LGEFKVIEIDYLKGSVEYMNPTSLTFGVYPLGAVGTPSGLANVFVNRKLGQKTTQF
jgi:hypothetical protein